MRDHKAQLMQAVALAIDGEWDAAHQIVQAHSDVTANWIHALLHKVEGDEWNSNYWYQKTAGKQYTDYADTISELNAIQAVLNAH
ncbi:MAG: hypothetical protein KFB94_08025 [Methylophilaceae bacterium]|jgi:hypothetical protein|nr:MAG: hypothetical protein KFB94_08025 [Methylophilaceae bacterium]